MTDRAPERIADFTALRRRLRAARGPAYWSSLEELAASPEFLERARAEFPELAEEGGVSYDRRRFLQLAAASMALMGLAACGPEPRPRGLVPYVRQPEGLVPGRSRYYATATTLQGYGSGVLIRHAMGRPLKVEGNPDHPASLGATSAIGQASILALYDPFRAEAVTHAGSLASWETLEASVRERRQSLLSGGGEKLALLTDTVTSPTLSAQIGRLKEQFPSVRWYEWDAVDDEEVRAGARLAFGRDLQMLPDFSAADVVLAVDGDFLDSAPGHLRFAHDFASRRRPAEARGHMSRMYALESTPTLCGAKADHRWPLQPAELELALRRLAGTLGAGPKDWASAAGSHAKILDAIAKDLRSAAGRALVQVGAAQPAVIHALAHAINHALGAFGKTITAIEPVATHAPQSLGDLTTAIDGGQIDTLLILSAANPVYTAPPELEFARHLQRVPFSLYLSEYADETAEAVQWHVPRSHEYETWSDVRAYDGTVTIQQPQAEFSARRRSAHELLALFLEEGAPGNARAPVQRHWREAATARGVQDFDTYWAEALRSGVVPDTQAARATATILPGLARFLGSPSGHSAPAPIVLFRPDSFLWDGRFAPNAWLQELPRPFTRLTWDNAVLIGPRTAEQLGLATADMIELARGSQRVRAPVWVLPGQAENCVTLPLGFGRRRPEPIAAGVGVDAYPLRTRESLWQAAGVTLTRVSGRHAFAPIQHEMREHDRDVVREGKLSEFLDNPDFLGHEPPHESLYPGYEYPGVAWAMSINLNACIGCQACVAACQAENNSPVVGKTEVLRGREMHWLRIDTYYEGALDDPKVVFQPVPCMHCEHAPCEVVCPVHATVHDSEGLNVMVYNRCVGTRFCSNNCPYKVRRFNFLDYTTREPRPRESWNPDVTVRGRGVMEKCTYCIQRTRAGLIEADKENRRLRDGEVVTACQQACPTNAIVFGDRNDPDSAVAARKASPLDYAMLGELNTRPRTTYEALIRNPNPDLDDV